MPAAAAPAKPAVDLSKQAFVGNLDRTATDESMEALFSKYNKPTFKKKGRGRIVTFASEKLVAKAIGELNGKVVEGVSYGEKGLLVKANEIAEKKVPTKRRKRNGKKKPSGEAVDVTEQKGGAQA